MTDRFVEFLTRRFRSADRFDTWLVRRCRPYRRWRVRCGATELRTFAAALESARRTP